MSNNTNYESSGYHFDPEAYAVSDGVRILQATIIAIIGTLGVTCNLVVIVSIVTTRELRTSHNAFILNLSVSDFLLSSVSTPMYFIAVVSGGWPLSHEACRFCVNISMALMGVSIFTLVLLTTNRYVLIARSRASYRRTCGRRWVAFHIGFVWVQSAVVVFIVAELVVRVEIDYIPIFGTCSLNPFDPHTQIYLTVVIACFVFLALLLIPVMYFMIFSAIHRSRLRVRAAIVSVDVELNRTFVMSNSTGPGTIAATSSIHQQQRKQHQQHQQQQNEQHSPTQQHQQHVVKPPRAAGNLSKEEVRLVKMSLVVFAFFFTCWLPQSITYTLGTTYPSLFKAGRFNFMLIILSPVFNPIAYSWMNKPIRMACLRLVKCHKCHM